jgi:radical SAM PhpK family P-methyltransferase
MKNEIDCLVIGNNQTIFKDYVNNIKQIGEDSGAFRDLNLSYYQEQEDVYSCSDHFNKYFTQGLSCDKMSYNNILSATITYLSTFLDKHGFSFAYINSYQEEKYDLENLLTQNRIRLIAITTTYYVSVLPILEIIQFIKMYNQEAKIIIGGPFVYTQYKIHTESSFQYLIHQLNVDFYVNSPQGEMALVNILEAIKAGSGYHDIDNVIYRKENKYYFNKLNEERNELSDNTIKWELFSNNSRKMVFLRTAISCPYSCMFCSFPMHAGAYRYLVPGIVSEELNKISVLKNVNSVSFVDDTFNVPFQRFKEIVQILSEKEYRFKWNCNYRCQYVDEETVRLMKESGCESVFLGIESGSNTILRNMRKESYVEAYIKGIQMLKKYGIITYASFIIGFPGETKETIMETFEFIEKVKPDFFRAQLWYYDTMTPIHHDAEKYGLVNSQFEWVHNTMSSREAMEWIEYFHENIKNSIWLPQNNFDYPGMINLLSRGWDIMQIKHMIMEFNAKVSAKLHINIKNDVFVPPSILPDAEFNF